VGTQEDFLHLVWEDINSAMQERWIENVIRASEREPDAPFADLGPALKRLLALGASRRDLSLLVRQAAYEQAFRVLYLLNDPGIDDNDVEGLHESLLGADPSGMDGRPGSAPALQTDHGSKPRRKKRKAPAKGKSKAGRRPLLKGDERVCFSPDGTLLASLGRRLTFWRCPEIEKLATISTISNACELAFSPDSRLLAVKNTSGRIALVDVVTQSIELDFRNQSDGEGSNLVFAADGAQIIDASWEGVHFVRTLDGKTTFREVFTGDMVTAVLRHPGGRYWFRHERPDERLIGRAWPFQPGMYDKVTIPFWMYADATFSPDGSSLAVLHDADPCTVTIFSFPAMESVRSRPISAESAMKLRYSRCGRLLAVAASDYMIVLNAKTLQPIETIPISYCFNVEFSPTAPLLAVGRGSSAEVFDTTDFLEAAGK
jgi:WD40 repeat protein